MSRQRDNVRDFPGKRWFNLSLRTLHIAGIVLLGGALLGGADTTACVWVTFVSRLGMLASETWPSPAHLREVAGFGILAKLALVAGMVVQPELALNLFWVILTLSTLLSHAPGQLRHRRLF